MVEGFTSHLQMDLFATIVAPDVWEFGKVQEYSQILAAAYETGRDAVLE
jgi:hypothetical protein